MVQFSVVQQVMGNDFIIVNLDKAEVLDFDKLGMGTKFGAMTSEPIASVLSWLLMNPEDYTDAPAVFGRWAGDRVEIIGSDQESRYEFRTKAQQEFRDVTFDVIVGFTAMNARGIAFKRMGLIDQNGQAVVNPADRESVAKGWRVLWDKEDYDLQSYMDKWQYVEDALRGNDPAQVRALRCPTDGGPMRIQFIHTKETPPHFRLSTADGRFLTSPFAPGRPAWVNVLGEDLLTEPRQSEGGAAPEAGASGGTPS